MGRAARRSSPASRTGCNVLTYTPPAGGNSIDGGTWSRYVGGPFGDGAGYDDASLYSTIQVGQFKKGQPPYLLARRSGTSFPTAPLVFYSWQGSAWQQVSVPYDVDGYFFDFIDANCSRPSCYLTLQTTNLAPTGRGANNNPGSAPDDLAELTGHWALGAAMWDLDANGAWNFLNEDYDIELEGLPPFADSPEPGSGYPDCPFSAGGATGAGNSDCLGSSPSYYETMQAADIDGVTGDELLARASDGLRVKKWVPGRSGGSWTILPTLSALGGAASSVPSGSWGSIRTGNIDGVGGDEVLFLDHNGGGLQAWSYDAGKKAWSQLPASPGLQLGSDPWLSHPEYSSTVQVGDVDGDGRDDVVARGPYGIRTWFYNRRGTGGWERYLADGYPTFATPAQQDAFALVNSSARAQGVITGSQQSVRDVWASENAPAATWPGVQSDLLAIGNCSGQTSLRPPQYATCTPPAPPSGTSYTSAEWAAAWTTVINRLMVENDDALKAVGFFAELKDLRDDLFLQENAELPAIGGDLGLQAAAGDTTQFNMQGYLAGAFGIGASIAGVVPGGAEASAALWVASEIESMIPQSSATATSSFSSTYAGLSDKFAQAVSETEKGIRVLSQEVRGDASLIDLVGQLRRSGAWNMDDIGLQSAANQGFATWVYRALMPTIYDRYAITNCYISSPSYSYGSGDCTGPTGLAVIGDTHNFTAIAQRHHVDPDFANWWETVPCSGEDASFFDSCAWTLPSDDLMNRIWAPVSANCSYQPGQSKSAWTFGCSAGVDTSSSIGANTWLFPSYAGSPDPGTDPAFRAAAAAGSSRLGSGASVVLGRPRDGLRRPKRGTARLRVNTILPRGMRLAGATIKLDRLLFEERGHGEVTQAHRTRAPRPVVLRLRRAAPGRVTATSTGRRGVRIELRRTGRRGRARLTMRIRAAEFRVPRACHGLPASVALDTAPLQLQSRLVISDGRTLHRILVRQQLRCARDARGNVDRLVPVRNRRYPARPGLAVSLRGPSRVRPGTRAAYVARVRNRRHGHDRLRSSLWDVTLYGRAPTKRIRELRRGRTRTFDFTVKVPRNAGSGPAASTPRGRFCVGVGVSAAGARGEGARVCSRVRAARARPPRFTG